MQTRHTLRLGTCEVHLLGTIHGFVPDAQAVRAILQDVDPDAVALGIPPEDVDGLADLAADEVELPELDPQNQRLLELLEPFGQTRVPSPDLEAAHAWAAEHDRPLVALDLDDEAHAELYIRHVKLRHVVQSSSINKKLLTAAFEKDDAHALALAWDGMQNRIKPLQAIEAAREAHMADGIRAAAGDHGRIVAIVPIARLAGIIDRLSSHGASPDSKPSKPRRHSAPQ